MTKGEEEISRNLVAHCCELLRASRTSGNSHRKEAVVIVSEVLESHSHLPQIIHASNAFGARFGLADGGQEQRCQDSNYGNDTKQFD